MGLYEYQRRRLEEALVDAFPTEELLDTLLTQRLGVRLSDIVSGTTQRRRVFQLIDWAADCGRLAELVAAARAMIPTHAGLEKALIPGEVPPESWGSEVEPEFAILITGYRAEQRLAVLKAVRELIPGTIAESVSFLDAALADPEGHPLATVFWKDKAQAIKRRLEAAGAEVQVVSL